MTQDEIIEMAKQAGMVVVNDKFSLLPFLEAFAKLVAAKERERLTDAAMKAAEKAVDVAIALEREACAKLCEAMNKYMDDGEECASAIRARGEA
jgi:uncharacterized protein (UPF0305 family)